MKAQDFKYEVKRVSHVLGFEGYAYDSDSLDSDIEIIDKLSGNHSKVTRNILIEKIKAYTPPEGEEKIWEAILDSFERASVPYKTNRSHAKRVDYTIKDYKHQDTGHITQLGKCGWQKHTINIAFYKSYMIVCNRGRYGQGNKIYKINRNNISLNDIAALEDKNRATKPIDTLKAINNLTKSSLNAGLNNPKEIAKFKSKMQKYGTCSYANLISSIEPMLALGRLELNNQLNDRNLQNSVNNRSSYKRFTKFCRDHEIERVISMLKNLKDDDDDVENSRTINFAHMICGKLVTKLNKQKAKYNQMDPDDLSRFLKLNLAVIEAEAKFFYSTWEQSKIEIKNVDDFYEANPSYRPLVLDDEDIDIDSDSDIETLDPNEPDIVIVNAWSSTESESDIVMLNSIDQTDSYPSRFLGSLYNSDRPDSIIELKEHLANRANSPRRR